MKRDGALRNDGQRQQVEAPAAVPAKQAVSSATAKTPAADASHPPLPANAPTVRCSSPLTSEQAAAAIGQRPGSSLHKRPTSRRSHRAAAAQAADSDSSSSNSSSGSASDSELLLQRAKKSSSRPWRWVLQQNSYSYFASAYPPHDSL
jgi:hypothetical protein